jgi:hypothetical protein
VTKVCHLKFALSEVDQREDPWSCGKVPLVLPDLGWKHNMYENNNPISSNVIQQFVAFLDEPLLGLTDGSCNVLRKKMHVCYLWFVLVSILKHSTKCSVPDTAHNKDVNNVPLVTSNCSDHCWWLWKDRTAMSQTLQLSSYYATLWRALICNRFQPQGSTNNKATIQLPTTAGGTLKPSCLRFVYV